MTRSSDQTAGPNNTTRENPGRWQLRSSFVPIYVPFLFLIPALILLISFRYIPAVSAIFHSFTYWNIPEPGEFIGLQNYQALLDDPIFIKSLGNILKYMVGRTALVLVMAFVGAELVYNLSSDRWRNFWRLVFTLPMVIPITVNLLVWQQVYAGRQGMLNEFLTGIGAMARPYPWLGRPDTALPALIFIGFPAVAGFGFLIILAALQNLSSEVNDAALIDGCSRLRRVFAIDLPAIRGPLALILILSLNQGMQEFAPMLVMTQGGPINTTMSPAYYLYIQGFTYGKHGYASAIGTVLMLMTLVLSIFILRMRYRRAYDVAV